MKPAVLPKKEKVYAQTIAQDEFLTTHELMTLLKIKHPKTIYNLIDAGMPKILVGRHYRFIKSEVIDFLKRRTA